MRLVNFESRAMLATLVLLAMLPIASYGQGPAYGVQQSAPESEIEYGVMGYSSRPRVDPVALFLKTNGHDLAYHPVRGYLDSLLKALAINPSSQLLVFSRTSLNVANIKPATPRAIYFNDEAYVAWVPDSGVIEIAAMDPRLGPVFYTLNQDQQAGVRVEQQVSQCLRCHDSYSMTGGGVPRFILGSGYTGANGNLVSHEGWILTDTSTPLQSRWGGWYVTGKHGNQVHLGNIAVNNPADLYQLENLRIGNLEKLDDLLNTGTYLTSYSDIVALLVIEHQVEVQNLITRVNYDISTALHNNPELSGDDVSAKVIVPEPIRQLVRDITEPLVQAMLMVNETPLTDTIKGGSGFGEWFEQQGPTDSQGRSLRAFDLQTRLFRYPLSYLIYSNAFDNLPWLARQQVYQRLGEILRGTDKSEQFVHLTSDVRNVILDILTETKPEFTR